mgnify:CR=1 FL=1
MQDWFTIDKIDDTTYTISEYRHWEETHCYLPLTICLRRHFWPIKTTTKANNKILSRSPLRFELAPRCQKARKKPAGLGELRIIYRPFVKLNTVLSTNEKKIY